MQVFTMSICTSFLYLVYFSWLRHDGHSSPVMIPGAEDLEYTVSLDDVGYKLILMYTPVSGGGMKGETQVATSEVIRAGDLVFL